MKTIKVAGATELQLNWLVAKIEGVVGDDGQPKLFRWTGSGRLSVRSEPRSDSGLYDPSTNWARGGPLKESQGIASGPQPFGGFWAGKGPIGDETVLGQYGSTELQAVLRCYVVSKLGEAAEVPEELL